MHANFSDDLRSRGRKVELDEFQSEALRRVVEQLLEKRTESAELWEFEDGELYVVAVPAAGLEVHIIHATPDVLRYVRDMTEFLRAHR